tara:strand:- start:182 stop:406 length:225 start_codon:yes stop_codon:yes gene_type:complete
MKQNSVKYWTNESRKSKSDWSWSRAKARITNKSAKAPKAIASKSKQSKPAKDWISQMGEGSRVKTIQAETVRYV